MFSPFKCFLPKKKHLVAKMHLPLSPHPALLDPIELHLNPKRLLLKGDAGIFSISSFSHQQTLVWHSTEKAHFIANLLKLLSIMIFCLIKWTLSLDPHASWRHDGMFLFLLLNSIFNDTHFKCINNRFILWQCHHHMSVCVCFQWKMSFVGFFLYHQQKCFIFTFVCPNLLCRQI